MPDKLIKKDLKTLWHPYTQMKDLDSFPPIAVKEARGARIFDHYGNFYYDTISSWWCNVHGHGHPYIKKAITAQLDKFEHVLFAGFTHEPAVELAEKLLGIAPKGLSRVFYSDNGSTSVEIAMKMSLQYWQMKGRPGKTSFLSFDRGYHGDTIGAMAIGGPCAFNERFKPLFFNVFRATVPYIYRHYSGSVIKDAEDSCYNTMKKSLENNQDAIAAVILEPLLLGAGGMLVYRPDFLKRAALLAKEYDTHLILDEVATGFGRTGKMFAAEYAGVSPDFMCVSKGITSGYLPLGVTLSTEDVFEAFYDDYDKGKTFFHGHTYTANPLACSAAIASLDLFKIENTLERAAKISEQLEVFLGEAEKFTTVVNTRMIGAVAAFDIDRLRSSLNNIRDEKRIGYRIYRMGLEKNLILRPLGDTIYFFMPLCVTDAELDDIFGRTMEILKQIT